MLVDECPAGPEMDAAVAEAAGWVKNFLYDRDGLPKRTAYVDPSDDYREVVRDIATWHPSIDIAAAWELVAFLHQLIITATDENDTALPFDEIEYNYLSLYCLNPYKPKWLASFDANMAWDDNNSSTRTDGKFSAVTNSIPLAICRAFLKANGIEYVGG